MEFSAERYLRKFAAFYLGCAACFLLQMKAHLSGVTASAGIGFAATCLPLPRRFDRDNTQAAIYAGTFAGMCSPEILAGHPQILALSLIGALVFVLTKPHFNGFGGKLGAVAFVSSLIFLAARLLAGAPP